MAVKKESKKEVKKEAKSFKEFSYSGKVFEYSGRIFPGKEGSGKVKRKWGLTIDLNGVLYIKGCTLVETDSNVFITYPQYYTESSKEWKSYIFTSKDLNDEIDGLVNELMRVVGIDGNEVVKAPEKSDEDMPF